MVKRCSEDPSGWGRSMKAYLILVGHASRQETTTYGALAGKISWIPRDVGRWLDPIAYHCINNGLPHLTSLVLSVDTGEPGGGYPGNRDTLAADRRAVYECDWFDLIPPTGEELQRASDSKGPRHETRPDVP